MIVPVIGQTGEHPTPDKYRAPNLYFLVYDETGKVIGYGREAVGFVEDRMKRGENISIITSPGNYDWWVDVRTGEGLPKTDCPARLDGLTLRDLPVPCTLIIDGQSYTVDDGVAELDFPQVGGYRVEVRSLRHKDKIYEVVRG